MLLKVTVWRNTWYLCEDTTFWLVWYWDVFDITTLVFHCSNSSNHRNMHQLSSSTIITGLWTDRSLCAPPHLPRGRSQCYVHLVQNYPDLSPISEEVNSQQGMVISPHLLNTCRIQNIVFGREITPLKKNNPGDKMGQVTLFIWFGFMDSS